MAKKEVGRSDIIIEGNTARWDIKLDGDINGTYLGTFRFKCYLLPSEKLAAGREYRELLGANPTMANKHEDNLAFSLAQLKYRILSAPPFWTSTLQQTAISGDLPDENVIDAVLRAAVEAELKYAAQAKSKRTDAIERAKKAAERLIRVSEEDLEADEKNGSTD
jgi:hypothetical protein